MKNNAIDFEMFDFSSVCLNVAEGDLAASFSDCPNQLREQFYAAVYDAYKKAGKPKLQRIWITKFLKKCFVSVGAPPKWVEDLPSWPWLNGKPMVFLRQFSVPNNEVATAHVVPNVEIYVFGARVPTSGGWKMEYRVVEQREELKGLVALVDSEAPPHTPANTKLVKRKAN